MKLKLAEESNNALSKQIQDYRSKNDDSIKIIHEKQQLVSISFFLFYTNVTFKILLSCYVIGSGARFS